MERGFKPNSENGLNQIDLALITTLGLVIMSCTAVYDPMGVFDNINGKKDIIVPISTPTQEPITTFENSFNSPTQLTSTSQP